MKKSIRNWSEAPLEIIGLIAERLGSIEDCVSFRGVCTSWRSAVLNHPHCNNVSTKTFAWMVFPQYWLGEHEDEEGKALADIHHFCSLSVGKYYKFNLPEATNWIVSGSPYGWLVLSDKTQVEIFNPLTRVCLPLPSLSTIQGIFHKVVLSMSSLSSPAKDRFRVFVLFWGVNVKLAFSTPAYGTWTSVDLPINIYNDVLELNNQVYIIDMQGLLRKFDVNGLNPIAIEFALLPVGIEVQGDDERTFYLVEMLNELYMVVKFTFYDDGDDGDDGDDYPFGTWYTYFFRVFKLHLGSRKWEEMFTLGDYAMFVGFGTSFSLPVSEYPEAKSSIYFTGNLISRKRPRGDTGICNLETRCLVALDSVDVVGFGSGAPYWFIPNLC